MRIPLLGTGLLLIAVGAVVLAGQAGALDASRVLADWWPLAIVWVAAVQWLSRPRGIAGPILLAGAGLVILGTTTDLVDASPVALVFALCLVAVGAIVIRSSLGDGRRPVERADAIDSLVIVGGRELVSRAEALASGSLITVFGGTELDLTSARLSGRGGSIGTFTIFGGTEIIVPREWRVELRATPIFAGVGDETIFVSTGSGGEPTLVVDGVVIFGALEVRNPDDASDPVDGSHPATATPAT